MNMKTAPCKGCDKRHLACHQSCESYQEYKAYREGYLQSRKVDLDIMAHIVEDRRNRANHSCEWRFKRGR